MIKRAKGGLKGPNRREQIVGVKVAALSEGHDSNLSTRRSWKTSGRIGPWTGRQRRRGGEGSDERQVWKLRRHGIAEDEEVGGSWVSITCGGEQEGKGWLKGVLGLGLGPSKVDQGGNDGGEDRDAIEEEAWWGDT